MTNDPDPDTVCDETTPEYDPERGVYVVDHDPTNERELSVTVVHAVLDVTDVAPTEVNLNDVVHPDALNEIFERKYDGTPRRGGKLSFRLAGCGVTVLPGGEVRIDPVPDE